MSKANLAERENKVLIADEGLTRRPLLEAINFEPLNKDVDNYQVTRLIANGVRGGMVNDKTTNVTKLDWIEKVNTYNVIEIENSWEYRKNKNVSTKLNASVSQISDGLLSLHDEAAITGLATDEAGHETKLPDRNLVSLSTIVASSGIWSSLSLTDIKTQLNDGLDTASQGNTLKKRVFDTLYMSDSAYRKAGQASAASDGQTFINWINTLRLRIIVDPALDKIIDQDGNDLGGGAFLYAQKEIKGFFSVKAYFYDSPSATVRHDATIGQTYLGGLHNQSKVDLPVYMIKGIA